MSETVLSYGVTKKNIVNSEIEMAAEEVQYNGFTILKNIISSEDLIYFRKSLDEIYRQQCEEIGGEENLIAINDAFIARSPLVYDPRFIELAAHPVIIKLSKKILGPSFVLTMQNGILNKPDDYQHQTRWHRDLNYQHWVSSKPVAINALFCLDPFTFDTGATHVLSGTHMHEFFPSESYVEKHQTAALATPGSLIVMDAMTFHRAGKNNSNIVRRAVNHVIGLPFVAQQMDLPKMLQGKWSSDPQLSDYLGYRWNPKEDTLSWRRSKLESSTGKNL